MGVTAKVLRFVAFGVLVAVALFGGFFAAGHVVADMPAQVSVLAIGLWLAVAGGLSWWAVRSPDRAVTALLVAVVLAALLTTLDGFLDLFDRNTNGPVSAMVVLALFVPLAVLGLRRALAAGVLLVALAAAQLVATVLLWTEAAGQAPPWAALFRGSSGILILPMALAGVLFLSAGLLMHESVRFGHLSKGARVAH